MGSSSLILSLLAFRLANALTVRTFFQPDEYFQSLEPAWRIAFGPESGAWITWEWALRLRSYIHPAIFGLAYQVAAALASRLDCPPPLRAKILIAAPKVVQALLAALIDFFTWTLARRVYGPQSTTPWATLLLTVTSPWQWFCSTRTLSNGLETTLTTIALCFWPWQWACDQPNPGEPGSSGPGQPSKETSPKVSTLDLRRLRMALLLAATACWLRPTNGLLWLILYLQIVGPVSRNNLHQSLVLTREAVLCGIVAIACAAIVEQFFYGQWTIPALQFVVLNVGQSIAEFYGVNRKDYYFTEGLELLLTTALPFAVVGIIAALKSPPFGSYRKTSIDLSLQGRAAPYWLAWLCLSVPTVFSFLSHKEVRFIYPILPPLLVLAGGPVASFERWTRRKRPWRLLGIFLLGLNVIIAFYASQVHQRGVIDVLTFLRHEHEIRLESTRGDVPPGETTAAFLMPCHSTPWRSHLVHPGIKAWALTCEPPVDVPKGERGSYMDEADVFYDDPVAWLRTNMKSMPQRGEERDTARGGSSMADSRRPWPQHLIFFAQLEDTMRGYLAGAPYTECWRGFNSHFHDDWRRKGDVVVWCIRQE